jgi:transcriptional regulator with XRE-family HTH domain
MVDASDVGSQFGRNMQRLRRQTGLSQEALGFRATLHRTEIGLLERGARVPRIDTLIKVAAALGVKIDCPLFDGISWSAGSVHAEAGEFTFSDPGESGEG